MLNSRNCGALLILCLLPLPLRAQSPAADAMVRRIDSASRVPAPWYVRELLEQQDILAVEGGKAGVDELFKPKTGIAEEQLLRQVRDVDAYLTITRLHVAQGVPDSYGDPGWIRGDLSETGSAGLQQLLDRERKVNEQVSGAVERLRSDLGASIRKLGLGKSEIRQIQQSVSELTNPTVSFSPDQLAAIQKQLVETALSPDGRKSVQEVIDALSKTEDGAQQLRSVLQQVGVSVLTNKSSPSRPLSHVDVQKVLPQLGSLQAAGTQFVSMVLNVGDDAQRELNTSLEAQQHQWEQIVAATKLGPVTDPLGKQIRQVEPFLSKVSIFTSVITGEDAMRGPAAIGALKSAARDYLTPETAAAVDAVMQIGAAKNTYAAAASIALDNLSKNSPELRQLTGTVSQVSQILQAAGPLIGLAGMSTGLGALSVLGSVGGFGGGGGPDPAVMEALREIQQSLNRIEGKLDEALVRLKGLQDEIRKNQEEVMSAFESLGYDMERTRVMLQDFIDAQNLKSCNVYHNDASQQKLTLLGECSQQLSAMYFQDTALRNLSIRLRYENKPGGTSALEHAKTMKKSLALLLTSADDKIHLDREACSLLRQPTGYFSDLGNRPDLEQELNSDEVSCVEVLAVDDFVDPGVLAGLVIREQEVFELSAQVADRSADRAKQINALRDWWKSHAAIVSQRWLAELKDLNLAIAQQQLIGGDFLLPRIASSLAAGGPPLDKIKQLFMPGSTLAGNAVRSWVYGNVKSYGASNDDDSLGNRFTYAVAYAMPTPELLTNVLKPAASVSITKLGQCTETERTAGEGQDNDWGVKIEAHCFALPTPRQVETGELLLTPGLRRLVTARGQLLSAMESLREASEPLPAATTSALVRAKALTIVHAQ